MKTRGTRLLTLVIAAAMAVIPATSVFAAENESFETEAVMETVAENVSETADVTEEVLETEITKETDESEAVTEAVQASDETIDVEEAESIFSEEAETSETTTINTEEVVAGQVVKDDMVKAAATYPYETPRLYIPNVYNDLLKDYHYNSDYTSYTITYTSKPYVYLDWYQVGAYERGRNSYRIYRKTDAGSWKKLVDVINTESQYYHDYNVDWGATYYYTVRSISADGTSFLSDYDKNGTKVTVFLETPPLISLTPAKDGIKFSWTSIRDVEKYRIYRKTGSGSWTKVVDVPTKDVYREDPLSYTDKTVKAGTKYTYTVRGILSNGKTFTTSFDAKGLSTTFVKPPVMKGAESVLGGVKVTWSAAAGAENYRVFRKTGSGSWTGLGNTTATSFIDKTAKSGTKYTYTVRAISKDGKTVHSTYDQTGKTVTYIAAPTLSSAQAVNGGVQVKWAKPAGAAKYRVFRKSGSSGWTKVADTTSTSYTDKTVASGTKYTYTVRCLSSDAKAYTSSYDSTGKTVTYVSTPVLSSAVNTSAGVKVTWKKPTGAVKFRVYRKTGSGSWAKVGDTTATSYVDGTAVKGTTYYYTVRCLSADGKEFQSYFDTTGKSVTVK